MKKTLLTISAFVLCLAMNAQSNFTENWPNGNKKTEGKVIDSGNPVVAGDSKEARASREMASTRDGKWTTWYENGNLHSEANYDKGKMVGSWKTLYENGSTEAEINFSTGKAVYFHKNGAKHSEGSIKDGMIQTGSWTGYFENGNKNYEGSYNNEGQKTGDWTWYNEQGKPVTTQTFSNGTLSNTKDLISK
jgi:antitoxin component YwqK of YwqJK toxin-antitoxin module